MVVAMDIAASGPALPAEPRPVHESAPLPSDYPAWGGVPQCLAAATEPVELAPTLWEVQELRTVRISLGSASHALCPRSGAKGNQVKPADAVSQGESDESALVPK